MRLGSKVMTGGFDWWEETMEHMVLVANDSREKCFICLLTEFR